jgi:gliding motility-associated protein GldM
MALPKEPRQKMINLMYLVLTALLALNVSAEILNAFKTVERSLDTTNRTISASTGTLMESFLELKADPKTQAKATEWEAKAVQAQRLTKDMNDYIEGLKARIMKEAGFAPSKENDFDSTFKEDNQDVATRIMVEEGKGKELKEKLQAYKNAMLAISPELKRDVETYLRQIDLNTPSTKNAANDSWEAVYFRMVPTVAATTMLTKFQNDIRTSENRVVARFHQMVGEVKVRFNQFATIKGQSSNYLMPGQELAITAGVGAFSSEAAPTITIGGRVIPVNEKGIAEFKTVVNSMGQGSIPIHYEWTDQEGNRKSFDDKITYEVGQSNAAIALPDMNVLYIGIENRVVVSGGGVGAEKLRVSIQGGGGNIIGANGNYVARVNSITDQCLIIASTTEGKELGRLSFRVRTVPRAVASVGGFESGATVNKAAFAAQAGVGAGIKDFPLNLTYRVQSFQVVADDPETGDVAVIDCAGNMFNDRAKRAIQRLESGSIVTIENIKCLGPDGRVTPLPSLLYNIR